MIGFVIAALLFVLSIYYIFLKDRRNYLQKQGVPSPPGYPIVGHILGIHFSKNRFTETEKYYNKYKKDGMFVLDEMGTPNLHVMDLDVIRDIMVKEFEYFQDRREFGGNDERLTESVFAARGEKWKKLRALLTPTFSSGKIKGMFNIIATLGDQLNTRVGEDMDQHGHVNARELIGYFTMDIVGACAFGLDTNLISNRDISQSEFMTMANRVMTPSKMTMFTFTFMSIFPGLTKTLGIKLNSEPTDYMEKVAHDTIAERKKSGTRRGDYLDLLLELKEENDKDPSNSKYNFTDNTLTAQTILFLLAGFDTTANSIAFTTYHLAKNPESQDKLRKELVKVLGSDEEDFNYQNVHDCPYLDAVISEALRIHSPVTFLERVCIKDFKMKDRDITIQKGTVITFLPDSLQTDPEYWNDPKVFRPERFLTENKAEVVPFTYMPFGLGPRSCIAARFAMMNAKICIAKLILNYELSLKPGEEEMKIMASYDGYKPYDDGIKLVVKKVKA